MLTEEFLSQDDSKTESIFEQLLSFSQDQLADISISEITENTAKTIVVCSFFSGSLRVFSETSDISNDEYRDILSKLIAKIFNMEESNANGLVDSNERLFHKYTFIENTYMLGSEAASQWQDMKEAAANRLKNHLESHKDITMDSLGSEGTKDATAEDDEEEPTEETTENVSKAQKKSIKPIYYWAAIISFIILMNILFALIIV